MKHHTGHIAIAIVLAVALHAALLAFVLTRHDAKLSMMPPSPAVTIQLLRAAGGPRARQTTQTAQTIQAAQMAQPHAPLHAPVAPQAAATPARTVAITPSHTASTVPASPALGTNNATGTAFASPSESGTGRKSGQSVNTSGSGSGAGSGSGVLKNVTHVDCRIVMPSYPDAAHSRGESGTAYVYFIIERSGKISHVELQQSSGFIRLDDAALAAVRRGSCRPYLENGKAVSVSVAQPFPFRLREK